MYIIFLQEQKLKKKNRLRIVYTTHTVCIGK